MKTNFKLDLFLYAIVAGLTAYTGMNGPIDAKSVASIILAIGIALKAKLSPGSNDGSAN